MLAEIARADKYASDNPPLDPYTTLTQPPNQHTNINTGETGAALKALEVENVLALRDFALVKRFRRAVNVNLIHATNATYFAQLKEDVYGYKRVIQREFMVELQQ